MKKNINKAAAGIASILIAFNSMIIGVSADNLTVTGLAENNAVTVWPAQKSGYDVTEHIKPMFGNLSSSRNTVDKNFKIKLTDAKYNSNVHMLVEPSEAMKNYIKTLPEAAVADINDWCTIQIKNVNTEEVYYNSKQSGNILSAQTINLGTFMPDEIKEVNLYVYVNEDWADLAPKAMEKLTWKISAESTGSVGTMPPSVTVMPSEPIKTSEPGNSDNLNFYKRLLNNTVYYAVSGQTITSDNAYIKPGKYVFRGVMPNSSYTPGFSIFNANGDQRLGDVLTVSSPEREITLSEGESVKVSGTIDLYSSEKTSLKSDDDIKPTQTAYPTKKIPNNLLVKDGEKFKCKEDIEPGIYKMEGYGSFRILDSKGNVVESKILSDEKETTSTREEFSIYEGQTLEITDGEMYLTFVNSNPTSNVRQTQMPTKTLPPSAKNTAKPTSTPKPTATPKPVTAAATTAPVKTTTKPASTPAASSKTNPKTGDYTPIAALSAVGVLSLAAFTGVSIKKRKNNKSDK